MRMILIENKMVEINALMDEIELAIKTADFSNPPPQQLIDDIDILIYELNNLNDMKLGD